MPSVPELYIGLMSGTSIDGIDAALVAFQHGQCQLVCEHLEAFDMPLTQALHQLCQPSDNEIAQLARVEQPLAEAFASACFNLLSKSGHQPADITAIGSHGQTIRHYPEQAFTLQIGDANIVAARTGINTIADFRRKDMALGGQGAPLVPAFHQALFQHAELTRAVVNIGGLANITYLPSTRSGNTVCGYDTGPGNTLLDAWFNRHHRGGIDASSYDKDGQWARSGQIKSQLLAQLMQHDYFQLPAPKSTGRELFNMAWLQGYLTDLGDIADANNPHHPADVQRTLTRFTALTIANEISKLMPAGEVYICGGGAANPLLMADISELLDNYRVNSTAALGVDPDWVEAIAFAWLAKQHVHQLPGNLPAVTGASHQAILGVYYPAG